MGQKETIVHDELRSSRSLKAPLTRFGDFKQTSAAYWGRASLLEKAGATVGVTYEGSRGHSGCVVCFGSIEAS